MTCYLLVDNGSIRPQATLQLRKLAAALSERCGKTVHAMPLMHADRIPPKQLNGEPAAIVSTFLAQQLEQGEHDFVVLPLFFGLSRALTSAIPAKTEELKQQYGEFQLNVADVVYPLPQGEPRLASIIFDHIQQAARQLPAPAENIVLVDHGSPIPQVTAVREHLAKSVQSLMKQSSGFAGAELEQAVMERRSGKEYDFNGLLLEEWLTRKAESGASNAIVVLMFFLPGRHAGEGGDIKEICENVMQQHPHFRIAVSPLISEHIELIDILDARLAGTQH